MAGDLPGGGARWAISVHGLLVVTVRGPTALLLSAGELGEASHRTARHGKQSLVDSRRRGGQALRPWTLGRSFSWICGEPTSRDEQPFQSGFLRLRRGRIARGIEIPAPFPDH